jgi:hypothetical protein
MNRSLFHRVCLGLLWAVILAPIAYAENLETPHFRIIYPPSDTSLAETITASMEGARETLTEALGVEHDNQLMIKIVPRLDNKSQARYLPDRKTIEVLTIEAMKESLGGRRPNIRFIKGVLWHEYIHFLQHQAMKRYIKDRNALWFIEGTAGYLGDLRFIRRNSPEAVWAEGAAFLSAGRLPTLYDLNGLHASKEYPLAAYFFSTDAVGFLIQQGGTALLGDITRRMGQGEELGECLLGLLGISLEAFEKQWHDDLEKKYRRYIRNS